MENSEFYDALAGLPASYRWEISDNNNISAQGRRTLKGRSFNPVTAIASRFTGDSYGTNKRETLRAGKDLGLTREFTNHVYNATTGVSNRGNTQVVRGKIRSALEI